LIVQTANKWGVDKQKVCERSNADKAHCDSNTADLKATAFENELVSSISLNHSENQRRARASLAANIVSLRHEKGWSQEALAFECGLHRTFVAHVERQARNIAIDNIALIASALGVETFELLVPPPQPG
jgi:ribosome-binding protein aMBF1 (putative translation factor)